jgi:hypothetical protein
LQSRVDLRAARKSLLAQRGPLRDYLARNLPQAFEAPVLAAVDCPLMQTPKDDNQAPGIQTAAENNIYRSRMDIRGPDRPSNAPCCLDLLRRHLRLFLGLRIGLDSRSHPRIAGCRGDDLFMAVGSGSVSICDLPSFRRSSRVIDLHRRISRHHRDRNDLVVACREQQALRLDRRERVIPWVNSCPFKSSLIPISEQRPEGGRRVDIIEIVDQWYGPGYRDVKVRGHDNSVRRNL